MTDELMIKKAQDNSIEGLTTHQVNLEIVSPILTEVNPGVFITVKARVTCPMKCNFKADKILILDHNGEVIKEVALIIPMGSAFETDPIVLKTPIEAGTYTWQVNYLEQEKEGICHLEASASLTFTVMPVHITSMAIWDVFSPVVAGDTLKFKVGLKCSAECCLTGQQFKVYNEKNEELVAAMLGELPWEDTKALYWAEVELPAPKEEGLYHWQVRLTEPEMEIPHLGTDSYFSFRVVKSPECTFSIKVLDKKNKLPVEGATIIVHSYRSRTDEAGEACIEISKGEYQFYVGGLGSYESYKGIVTAFQDTNIEVELEASVVLGD